MGRETKKLAAGVIATPGEHYRRRNQLAASSYFIRRPIHGTLVRRAMPQPVRHSAPMSVCPTVCLVVSLGVS